MKRLIFCMFVLATFGFRSLGQEIIDTHRGAMELFGLEKWTSKMIRDTMKAIAPNQPLIACAAVMKERLGFPQTSVIGDQVNDKTYWYSILVEPQRAHLIKDISQTFSRNEEQLEVYQTLVSYYKSHFREHQIAMGTYGEWKLGNIEKAEKRVLGLKVSLAKVREIWSELSKLNSEKDLTLALDVLKNDENGLNRLGALGVLMNFPNDGRVWHQVIKSSLDKENSIEVTTMMLYISHVFSRNYESNVDWSPVKEEIRHLVNGSNVNVFTNVLRILNNGNVSREIVRYSLQDGGHIVTSFLTSSQEELRNLAHNYLLKASDTDFGFNSEAWKSWLFENLEGNG